VITERKNNLNVIPSLLDTQSMDIKGKDDATEAFEKSRDRIYAMALVHDELYSKYEGLAKVDMQSYLVELTSDLSQICGHEVGIVVNELVTNSLKYAFSGKGHGTIRITMSSSGDNKIELLVSDDRRGFSIDEYKKRASAFPTSIS